jgi:hypothetical protein
MEGASSGIAGHLDDILPKDVQFILSWNPLQLRPRAEGDSISLRTRPPPDTALSAMRATANGSSRQAAFYDRHLAPHLILERVVYFDTLVSVMANTVDQAIQEAVAKRPLPKDTAILMSGRQIESRESLRWTRYRETGVAEAYLKHAAEYCSPIASTLALHPSSEQWDSILDWSSDGEMGRWAIADGTLLIPQDIFQGGYKQKLLQNEDDGKKDIIKQLAFNATALAVWEMKSLTVGTAQVMQGIAEMGLTHAKFPWKKCTLAVCTHKFLDSMEESSENYDTGFDPRSPPWTLPIVPSTSSADSRPTPLGESRRSASAQGGTNARPSYVEPSPSPAEDGEGERKRKRHNGSDVSELERPPPKKPKKPKNSKADLRDESYEPPTGARKEVNAQAFLQQVAWSFIVQIPDLTAFTSRHGPRRCATTAL